MRNVIHNINYLLILMLTSVTLLAACSQSQEQSTSPNIKNPMLFSVENLADTKVTYNNATATFSENDEVGLYAFYNNFYHYYTEYQDFAESVIFPNSGMKVKISDNQTTLYYSPQKSWTFSTLYGTAPFKLDVVAYFPFKEGYHPEYIEMLNSDDKAAATLKYQYYDDDNNINCNIDFMTAHTTYEKDENGTVYTAEAFRAAMLALPSIKLQFKRQTAALNLKVSKPDGYTNTITVKSIKVEYYAPKTFTQTVYPDKVTWSTIDYEKVLYATALFKTPVELAETNWSADPTEGATSTVADLFGPNDGNMLYFPPGSDINKIVFTIDNAGSESTYTWHPHIAPIEANTTFTLNLELDPAREN